MRQVLRGALSTALAGVLLVFLSQAYPETGIGRDGSRTDPADVAGNAFYDPACDLIAYDRALLEELSTDYGRFLAPVVMAHEFGHAMQGRLGFAANGRSIQDETQADCFARAWTGWVAAGKAEHVSLRRPELDDVVRGFLLLRDDVGSDPADSQARGNHFDRVSAFYEGFDGGSARAGTTSARTGCRRPRRSPTTPSTPVRATRPSTTS